MEVAPNSKPPVCKILNYGKIKYEAKKKLHNSKKKQHVIKIIEVRVRPAIGENDLKNEFIVFYSTSMRSGNWTILPSGKSLHESCRFQLHW